MPDVVAPRIVRREEHSVSRRDIDPDALKVLYRLRQYDHVAYLVGGSVRDLLLGRRPKDFDVGTSAHPYQVKKLFRNCWIIGRRFRLAHVKFGMKVIEVATFRRQVVAGEEVVADGVPALEPLSDRERDVLHLLALGHTNQEIGKKLFISVRTVDTHRAHIMRKLRLKTRAELVLFALANGLIGAT